MKQSYPDGRIPTLHMALMDHMDTKYTNQKLPSKKADLTGLIKQHLAGDGLKRVWLRLDELQRAAVAEAVHSTSSRFVAERFKAKYGRVPNGVLSGYWSSHQGHQEEVHEMIGYTNGI